MRNEVLQDKLEPMYRHLLHPGSRIHNISRPQSLLTWNRLDLVIKLLYLEHRGAETTTFESAYYEHLKAFSLGTFKEPGNENKNSLNAYLHDFDAIYEDLAANGFDHSKSLIPLALDGSIANGAHRVAAAIALSLPVTCVDLAIPPSKYDWSFFRQRGMPLTLIELAATEFVRRASRVHVALLWPRSAGAHAEMLRSFNKVIYVKTIYPTRRGIHNLLSICYQGEPWMGSREKNFPGTILKSTQIYRDRLPIRVIAFQADNLDLVQELKHNLRRKLNYDKHSIHITDSPEEAVEVTALLFNTNGIHFLNFANPNAFKSLNRHLQAVRHFIDVNGLVSEDVIIDSSLLLELYGLRKANDIDILVKTSTMHKLLEFGDHGIQLHDGELHFHGIRKDDLLFDPAFHFTYKGLKFLGLTRLYHFKQTRAEKKDLVDMKLMSGLLKQNRAAAIVGVLAARLYFLKARYFDRATRIVRRLISCAHSRGGSSRP